MKRLFIAIDIPGNKEVLQTFNDFKASLPLNKIKWVDANLFHLTLKFLGDTSVYN